MKLRLDPWAAEYNTAYQAEDLHLESRAQIDPVIEYETWQSVNPTAVPLPYERLLFVDGTRRLEARVLLEDERKQVAFGALGSFGIGVIDCCARQSRQASFLDLTQLGSQLVHRLCTLGSGYQLADFEIRSRFRQHLGRLEYQVVSSDKREAEEVVRKLQFEMLDAERQLASRLTDAFPEALVITDGPRPRMGYAPNVIGYVKTIHEVKLGEAEMAVVRALEEGQRSPLYLVSDHDKSQQLFEWFLRLRDPRPWLYSLAGMVRLQAYAGSNPLERLGEVRALADALAVLLPRFASRQHQDPRAPQQLLPIRALESELRRRMGDAGVVRRRIMQYLQELG